MVFLNLFRLKWDHPAQCGETSSDSTVTCMGTSGPTGPTSGTKWEQWDQPAHCGVRQGVTYL